MKIRQILLTLLIISITIFSAKNIEANSGLKPKIQLAILLDSSNSMDGLIDQAKSQLWKIVNHLTKVTKNGQKPELEIALYHYGNDSLPSEEGFLTQLTGFTSELDLVSQKLFEIKTNGGQEYAGWVINSATKQLQWSNSKEDFHAVFIAGNEGFDQGSVAWNEAVKTASQKDIIVNTIYCGSSENQERDLWTQAANLGEGSSFNIDQNRTIVNIPTPYDEEINNWNQKLNQTYIPYGEEGFRGLNRQAEEDVNAYQQGVLSLRGASKVSDYYRNSSWDLIDALTEGVIKLENVNTQMLPSVMQTMSLEEKRNYINGKQLEREKIKKIIAELYQKRTAYIEEKTREENPTDTLDYVIIESLTKQLSAKGFTYNKQITNNQ